MNLKKNIFRFFYSMLSVLMMSALEFGTDNLLKFSNWKNIHLIWIESSRLYANLIPLPDEQQKSLESTSSRNTVWLFVFNACGRFIARRSLNWWIKITVRQFHFNINIRLNALYNTKKPQYCCYNTHITVMRPILNEDRFIDIWAAF